MDARRKGVRAALLNGAERWQEYSDGGCSLIYDGDIAARVCTPSEYKRAFSQAARFVCKAVKEVKSA